MSDRTDRQAAGLAGYYGQHDVGTELEQAEELPGPAVEPFVTVSVRLPMPIMREVRRIARQRGIRPTVLMREWIEAQVSEHLDQEEAAIPLSVLRSAIAEHLTAKG